MHARIALEPAEERCRHTPSLRFAEAPRCVSAIAYNCGERATVAGSIALRQLPRCAAAHTTWPKEKKTRRPGSAAGRTQVWPQTKNKTRRQPLIRAPAHLRARWVLGHEDCMARRAATGKDAARKGRNETAAAPHEPTLSASTSISFSSLMPANGLVDGVYHTMRGFGPPIYSLAGSECPSRVLLEGLDPRWQQSHF